MTLDLEHPSDASLRFNQELEAVNELAEALTLGRGVDSVIDTALKRVIALMEVDVGSIYLLEKEGVPKPHSSARLVNVRSELL